MAGQIKGPNTIVQDEHLDLANAKKVLGDVLIPGDVITSDASAAGILVGKGNLLRVRVSAATFVAFGSDPSMAAVTNATSPGLELNSAGVYLISCTDDYVRMSVNPARLERIQSK